jgi:hypothetical protein
MIEFKCKECPWCCHHFLDGEKVDDVCEILQLEPVQIYVDNEISPPHCPLHDKICATCFKVNGMDATCSVTGEEKKPWDRCDDWAPRFIDTSEVTGDN